MQLVYIPFFFKDWDALLLECKNNPNKTGFQPQYPLQLSIFFHVSNELLAQKAESVVLCFNFWACNGIKIRL